MDGALGTDRNGADGEGRREGGGSAHKRGGRGRHRGGRATSGLSDIYKHDQINCKTKIYLWNAICAITPALKAYVFMTDSKKKNPVEFSLFHRIITNAFINLHETHIKSKYVKCVGGGVSFRFLSRAPNAF